ncbi:MAG TPA: hypothetical protein VGZ28_02315 [Terriglobales bacterium]|nr:hypothetical protein [Terriglobales bacterium]
MRSREILTPAQNAHEALDLERERDRPSPYMREPDGFEKQEPTPDALTVLRNEAERRKANYGRERNGP